MEGGVKPEQYRVELGGNWKNRLVYWALGAFALGSTLGVAGAAYNDALNTPENPPYILDLPNPPQSTPSIETTTEHAQPSTSEGQERIIKVVYEPTAEPSQTY